MRKIMGKIMGKKILKTLFGSVLVLAVFAAGNSADKTVFARKTGGEQIAAGEQSGLKKMSKVQLIAEIKSKVKKKQSFDVALYAACLSDKIGGNDISLLTDEVKTKKNTAAVQTLFYDILRMKITYKDAGMIDEVKSLLDEKTVCENVKKRIINEYYAVSDSQDSQELKNDEEVLKQYASGNNKSIAASCVRRLYESDPEEALKIAGDIIDKKPNENSKLSLAARYIVSNAIADGNAKDDSAKLLDQCIECFEKAKNDDVRASWTYALADTGDERALQAVMSNPDVSDEEKLFAVCGGPGDGCRDDTDEKGAMRLSANDTRYDVDCSSGMQLKNMKTDMLNNFKKNSTEAGLGKTGCAIFRNGVLAVEWHSAISTVANPRKDKNSKINIVHAPGPRQCVRKDSWKNFLDGNTFKGFYKSKKGTNKVKRQLIAQLAKKLSTYDIPYCFLDMILVRDGVKSAVIYPEYISALRCDGVVEYCYEYYGLKLQGGSDDWDITKNKPENLRAHSLLYSWVSPKNQASCMKPF